MMNEQQPRIVEFPPRLVAGMRVSMSLTDDRTFVLWNNFMKQRSSLANVAGSELYSIRSYSPGYFRSFDPSAAFDKWAAAPVDSDDALPAGMQSLNIPGGEYAVFTYKGTSEMAGPFYEYVYMKWLPSSGYILDDRPHFEIMGPRYRHGDPDSEEDVYIPVRRK
jgi:AraC family transcriptional regulator